LLALWLKFSGLINGARGSCFGRRDYRAICVAQLGVRGLHAMPCCLQAAQRDSPQDPSLPGLQCKFWKHSTTSQCLTLRGWNGGLFQYKVWPADSSLSALLTVDALCNDWNRGNSIMKTHMQILVGKRQRFPAEERGMSQPCR